MPREFPLQLGAPMRSDAIHPRRGPPRLGFRVLVYGLQLYTTPEFARRDTFAFAFSAATRRSHVGAVAAAVNRGGEAQECGERATVATKNIYKEKKMRRGAISFFFDGKKLVQTLVLEFSSLTRDKEELHAAEELHVDPMGDPTAAVCAAVFTAAAASPASAAECLKPLLLNAASSAEVTSAGAGDEMNGLPDE